MYNKTINGYTIVRKIGEGGMAEVWYAENNIGRPAAFKFLKTKFCADENVVERFQNEAKVMVRLNHPNIRQVYDYVMFEGRPCIVMEYLEGQDLKKIVKENGAIDAQQAIQYWNQIVSALKYTHDKDVIHRDIKPSNIFLTNEGKIKLLDYGIAKIRDVVTSTQTGQKLGTLVYMSPEQINDSKHVDSRTDIYSLAVTFVNLLAGRIPYDSDSSSDFEIMRQIVYDPLDMEGVPDDWRKFLLPYLEKDPAKRIALREFSATSSTKRDTSEKTFIDTPGEPSQQKDKYSKRSKILMWITGIMMSAVLVMSAFLPKLNLYCYDETIEYAFYLGLLILATFLAINISFMVQSKDKKSKWIFLSVMFFLLVAQYLIRSLTFTLYEDVTIHSHIITFYKYPIVFAAVGIEGFVFAKLFGRKKWINITIALLLLVMVVLKCLLMWDVDLLHIFEFLYSL